MGRRRCLLRAASFGVFQLCAQRDVRLKEPRDRTIGFGADCSANEIVLICPGRFDQNVKLNACDGPVYRQLFHRDSGGGVYAMRAKPRPGKRMRELHREACGMGGCDQFVGILALSLCVAGRKVFALRKDSTLRLSVFFNFAREQGWCSESPLLTLHKAKVRTSDIGILTPGEFARLLENASVETLPYWAIGGFAGLRTAELERLDWVEVHFDSDLIEVKAAKSKTASRRFLPIRPALKQWLAPYERQKGKVAPKTLRKRLERDRRIANIEHWPSNALRHSFASYHAAEFRDAGMLALELGHRDQRLIFAHYRELVRPTDAHKYWNLRPPPPRLDHSRR